MQSLSHFPDEPRGIPRRPSASSTGPSRAAPSRATRSSPGCRRRMARRCESDSIACVRGAREAPEVLRPGTGKRTGPEAGAVAVRPAKVPSAPRQRRALGVAMFAPAMLYVVAARRASLSSWRSSTPSATRGRQRRVTTCRPRELPQHAPEPELPRPSELVRLHASAPRCSCSSARPSSRIALENPFRGRGFVRFLILLPWVAPVSIGSIGWKWILDSLYSVINWVLIRAAPVQALARRCGSASRTWRCSR